MKTTTTTEPLNPTPNLNNSTKHLPTKLRRHDLLFTHYFYVTGLLFLLLHYFTYYTHDGRGYWTFFTTTLDFLFLHAYLLTLRSFYYTRLHTRYTLTPLRSTHFTRTTTTLFTLSTYPHYAPNATDPTLTLTEP